MIQGYLLSLLTRQRALLGDRFDARYPHAWLVWEPGARQRPQTAADLEAGKTQLPARPGAMVPVGNDAVCFPLPEPTRPGNCLTLGRQPDSSITIDDMSVSREHARLFVRSSKWQLEPIGRASTLVASVPIREGQSAPLSNGCTILVGGVTLTFYERLKLLERLVAEERRSAP